MRFALNVSLCCMILLPLFHDNNAFAEKRLRVLVVTGGHSFDQAPFEGMFKEEASLECVFLALQDESEVFEDISNWSYDVLVLYNMTQEISAQMSMQIGITVFPARPNASRWSTCSMQSTISVMRLPETMVSHSGPDAASPMIG